MSPLKPPKHTSKPLPAYRHVPGQTPHPTRSMEGHSHVAAPQPCTCLPDLNKVHPPTCHQFLLGIDLFNACYWWECHEAMESLWHVAGRGSPAGHTLQAVIQCAAAHLKVLKGNIRGARLLFAHAEDHVARAESFDLGLDLIGMLAETGAYIVGDSQHPAVLILKTDQQSHHGDDFD